MRTITSRHHGPIVATLAALSLLCAVPASAQTLDPAASAARRELIDQALAARDAGRHEEALQLGTRAGALEMSASLRRFIAEEQAATGRLAEALGSAQRCSTEADRDTGPHRMDHIAACNALVSDLRLRVGHIVLQLANAPADVHVTVGGTEVPRALWGVPYVVTPGTIAIEVTSPHHETTHQSVSVERGQSANVELQLGAEQAGASTASSAPSGTASQTPDQSARSTSHPAASSIPIGPVVMLAAGAVFLIVGGIAAALQSGQVSQVNHECGGDYANCMAPDLVRARSDYDTAVTYTIVADTGFALAAVAGVGGAIWWIVSARGHRETARSTAIHPWLANGAGGFFVGGRF
jgi:hypothetical protein